MGRGIEVGPGKNPICARDQAIFVDRFANNIDATPAPDIISDAALIPVGESTFDFLASSHMLEHHQDTLRVLYEWKRVLKPAATVFLILPHYARTFDKYRTITTLQHHICDYANLGDREDHSHFREIREGWSKVEDFEEQRARFEARWQMDTWDWAGRVKNGLIHYHVWTQNEVVDLLRYIGMSIEYVADVVPDMTNSFLVVGRR